MRKHLAPLALVASLTGCATSSAGARRSPAPPGLVVESRRPLEASTSPLLSARFVREGDSEDELLLVFSGRVDAPTLQAVDFIVVRDDGSRIYPARALLWPADERDEHRSVLLQGDFGLGSARALQVVGALFTVDGVALESVDGELGAEDEPDVLVAAEVLTPAEGRCEGAASMVRTYWSDRLGPLSAQAVERMTVELEEGAPVHPVALDDHGALAQAEPAPEDDNVLDLCLDTPSPARAIRVDAAAVVDLGGRPSAAGRIALP